MICSENRTNTTSYSLFDNPWDLVNARTAKKYEDPKAWCNVFFDQVTSKINERIFAPLFSDNGMGAPNASIRILVAMSIIKEGFQLSDETLIEKCDADIVTRRALGLMNLSDSCPSIDKLPVPPQAVRVRGQDR
ncbi:MAG: transposase [Bacteroidales bacterium]|nr:transposase [Bacteroidales bacterium]